LIRKILLGILTSHFVNIVKIYIKYYYKVLSKQKDQKSENQMVEINKTMAAYSAAAIASLIGAILLLADDFLGYYIYVPYGPDVWGYIWVESDIYGPIIGLIATFLFICTAICAVGAYKSEFINKRVLQGAIGLSLIVFFIIIIGLIVAAGELSDADDWWGEGGLYGGIICSLLAGGALVFNYWDMYKRKAIS
jgi:hypothetical protein